MIATLAAVCACPSMAFAAPPRAPVVAPATPTDSDAATPSISAPAPRAGDLATARNALKEGLALREKGDLVAALGRLATAFDLVKTPVTCFELGKTHLLMGHVMQAHELFQKVGRIPPALEESERSATARQEASRLAGELEPRIPSLRIQLRIPSEAKATVNIDDDAIPIAGAITLRAVDPGRHVIVARAGDGPDERVTIDIAEGETKLVELAPHWLPPKASPPKNQVVYLRQTNPLVFVGFAASSVAFTLTGVSTVLAVNAAGRAHDGCGQDYCPKSVRDSDISVMHTWMGVSIVGAAATLVFLTVGVLSISRPTNEKVTAGAKPYIGPGGAGLIGRF